jgi:hypothetical protein
MKHTDRFHWAITKPAIADQQAPDVHRHAVQAERGHLSGPDHLEEERLAAGLSNAVAMPSAGQRDHHPQRTTPAATTAPSTSASTSDAACVPSRILRFQRSASTPV